MGALVEQAIPTLFGGVSRQPASVRRPNQVEDAENALLSVVTGGFEKRPPTQLIAYLDFLDPAAEFAVHAIDRDPTEQTFLVVNSDGIQAVNTITGDEITVTIGDSTRYFLIEQDGIDGIGIVQVDGADFEQELQFDSSETALSWSYSLSDSSTVFKLEGSADGNTWNDIATGKTGASGTFSTTIDAVATGDHNHIRVTITTAASGADDTITLKATFKDLTYLLGADPEDLKFATVADSTLVVNRNVTARMAEAGSGSITSTVQEFSDLPAAAADASIHKIVGTDADGFSAYYVKDDTGSVYVETVNPTAHNAFDPSSMPHWILRSADGTFTYSSALWDERGVGDEDIVEEPKFVGKKIQDLTFYRNRLVILADEEVYTSRTGDVFNLWPEKAVEVLDTDPVSRAATTTDVNILRFGTVFRKAMFATSDRAQFELSSDGAFTPESALFDLSTTYAASPLAKPKAVGDVLYFPAKTNDYAIVYEYFFDEASLSNKASDITKHVVDYIPNEVLQVVGDPATNTVFSLTTGEQNSVFVYRAFFDGLEKLQSAWSKYTFGASEAVTFIHGIAVLSGYLVLMLQRQDGAIYLEQMPIEREAQNTTVGFTPFVDQREVLTGTYDAATDATFWDLTSEHNDDAQLILGSAFSEPGRQVSVVYPDKFVLSLSSVVAGETVVINGVTFTAHATTTTASDREFKIDGTDAQDVTALVGLINDATFGVEGVTATDNSDGTLTIVVDDKLNGSIATPTGTAVTSGTVTAAQIKDLVAASGDLDAGQVWVGRPYEMAVDISELFFRQDSNEAVITGRLQLKDISFLLDQTGYLKVTVTPEARTARAYTFEGKVLGSSSTVIGKASIADAATMRVPIWARSNQVTIRLSNDQPVPSIVTAAAWRGFFNELSRQE